MRLPTLILTLSLLAPLTPALQVPEAPQATTPVDAILALAGDADRPTQGPLLALGLAHGLTLQPVNPLPPRPLTQSLLDLHLSTQGTLTGDDILRIQEATHTLPAPLHPHLTPIIDALTKANNLGIRLQAGDPIEDAELLHAALQLTAAVDDLMLTNQHEPLPWPEEGWTAPLGIIRIGTPGPDTYTQYHDLSIDPHGDDTYLNNGGSNWQVNGIVCIGLCTIRGAALALDLQGNDTWDGCSKILNPTTCQYDGPRHATSHSGIAIAIDSGGNDTHHNAGRYGAAHGGLAAFLDLGQGHDTTLATVGGILAYATGGLVLYYDQGGNDHYQAVDTSIGYTFGPDATALFLDHDGTDDYAQSDRASFAKSGCFLGRSIYIDNGTDPDLYPPQVTNGATWTTTQPSCSGGGVSTLPVLGVGIDN